MTVRVEIVLVALTTGLRDCRFKLLWLVPHLPGRVCRSVAASRRAVHHHRAVYRPRYKVLSVASDKLPWCTPPPHYCQVPGIGKKPARPQNSPDCLHASTSLLARRGAASRPPPLCPRSLPTDNCRFFPPFCRRFPGLLVLAPPSRSCLGGN